MARGRTKSSLTLSKRRETAFKRFLQGWNNADVARELRVTPDTVTRYRRDYEAQIKQQAAANPRLLINVVENTVRALTELEEVRKETWKQYEKHKSKPSIQAKLLRDLAGINRQKAELFGLFGVKQEYFIHVQNVQAVQQRLLEWMRQNLCADDRTKLEQFMMVELRDFMGPTTANGVVLELPVPEEAIAQG